MHRDHHPRPRARSHLEEADQLLWRTATTHALSGLRGASPIDTAASLYGGKDAALDLTLKAAAGPATTTTPEWASLLVGQTWPAFADRLSGRSVLGALTAATELRIEFGKAGRVVLPQHAAGDLAPTFVGEGDPIAAAASTLGGVAISPHKAAVIVVATNELLRYSVVDVEAILRELILDSASVALDQVLLDDQPASVIRPAGLLDGVTPITGTADPAADIAALIAAVASTTGGGRQLALIANPAQLAGVAAGLVSPVYADNIEVIVSPHAPAGTVIVLDVADFVVGAMPPEFDLAGSPLLDMETPALPIVSGAGVLGKPQRSTWQTDTSGLRVIIWITWTMRRTGLVAAAEVTW